jgi:hypothetical protein
MPVHIGVTQQTLATGWLAALARYELTPAICRKQLDALLPGRACIFLLFGHNIAMRYISSFRQAVASSKNIRKT